ncbi:MAG TPA: HAMP domain-containing protein [Gammaproteobacteria bacterium]|nr:HAMP domain-containing protein [Gammaproteobacteria bacterium]
MRSLRSQLWRSAAAVMALLALSLWLIGQLILNHTLTRLLESRLQHDAETLLAAVNWQNDTPRLDRAGLAGVYAQVRSGHYYVIETDDGRRFRSRSLWDREMPLRRPAAGDRITEQVSLDGGETVLVRHAGYRKQGHRLWIGVAEDIAPLKAATRQFNLAFLLTTLAGFTLLSLLQGWRIRRALRPLDAVRGELERIAAGAQDAIHTETPSEIAPLIAAFNRLLAQHRERIRRSRNALGNLAHALKTPLNLLRQEIETVEDEKLNASLGGQVERLCQLTERELRRARIAGPGGTAAPFAPRQDLQELIEVVERIHPGRRIALEIRGGDGPVAVDREDALELVGNLLDNACKWAAGTVRLSLDLERGFRLRIEDDGPGIPPERRASLLGRGQRLDEEAPGHGLGLSIVQDIVESYDGELRLGASEALGGLRVDVRL